MRNQLRLLPTETISPTGERSEVRPESDTADAPRRRRRRGPSDRAGRIDTRTRRAGRQGVAAARQALLAATAEAELPRAG
jgi:hypothetical protein